MRGLSQDDIIRMAREADLLTTTEPNGYQVWIPENLERFAALVAAAEREKVAHWMMARAYATGHGESIEELLQELEWQMRENEREACAKVLDEMAAKDRLSNYFQVAAIAIRARGNDAT